MDDFYLGWNLMPNNKVSVMDDQTLDRSDIRKNRRIKKFYEETTIIRSATY